MKINIRQEKEQDHQAVFQVIKSAFETVIYSDQSEPFLVERLRTSTAFIPELSLVAETGKKIIGHILMTQIKIKNDQRTFTALALAPVSVHPDFQKKGIGAKLIEAAHNIAKSQGHQRVILVGHEDYYPRFGYHKLNEHNISLPFEVPPQNQFALALTEDAFSGVEGTVEYAKEFFTQ